MSSSFPRIGIVSMGAGFILLGIFSLLATVMLMRDEWSFLTDSARVVGRISGNEMRNEMRRGEPQPVYELLYTFQDAEQTPHIGRDHVRADIWARAKPGDLVAVQYLTAEPSRSRIAKSGMSGLLGAIVAASVGTILVALGIFLLVNRKVHIRT